MQIRATVLVSSLVLCSCGFLRDLGGSVGGGGKPNPTVDAVLKGGLPDFLTISPQLPEGFSAALGVAGASDGQPDPGKMTMSAEVTPASGSAAFEALLGEARVLSAWGFSETRRLEVLAQSLLVPVFDLLARKELFESRAGVGESGLNLSATRGGLFEGLVSQARFAVKLPRLEGFPTHLVLSSSADLKGVIVRGVWSAGQGLTTGFMSEIRMDDAANQTFTFSLAPNRMPGLVKNWKASSCVDDVFSIKIDRNANSGRKALMLRSWECPGTRNAVGTLSLAFDGALTAVESAFAQDFDNLTGPRSMFGRRQGFVLQAAASGVGDSSRLAAALALAGERDFSRSLGELFGTFSIASLFTQYGQRAYLDPMADTPTGLLTCGVGRYLSESVADVCAKRDLSPELMVDAVSGLREAAGTVGATDFENNLSKLAQVLAVKNSIFVSKGGTVFGASPGQEFSTLDADRSRLGTLSLASLSPRPSDLESLLPTYASESDLPAISFEGSAGALQSFWESKCAALAGDSLAKAGESSEKVSALCAD